LFARTGKVPVHFVVALRYALDFTTPLYLCLVTLQAYVPAVIFPDNVRFASNVGLVGDVTSVNTVLRQCNGKVVRLHIQFEITCSTTVVEYNTTMPLVI